MLATHPDIRVGPAPLPRRALSGRVALVTGSTSGIGLGIAKALAAEGADVMLHGLGDRAAFTALCDDLSARHGVRVDLVAADLGEPGAVAATVERTITGLGRVDILVNNAGIQHVAPLQTFPTEKWDAILAVNLSAAFHAMQAALPGMTERRWGRIVNIASAHGLVASPFKSAYVAAKHGLLGLTKTAALETAQTGVTVNAVCPGYVWTPLVEKQIEEQAAAHGIARDAVIRDVLLKEQPNRRFTTVEEIGGAVAFLCSENAASMTGASLAIDGGWTAH
ncbi:MAG: 3-hydroxybutyrate dehydrogenase [Geminicoccaceae bacterium]